MRQRTAPLALIYGLSLAAAGVVVGAGRVQAQNDSVSPVPNGIGDGDAAELLDDDDVEGTDGERAHLAADVARVPPAEVRSHHAYAASLAWGRSKPWENYGFEAAAMAAPRTLVGLYGGGGGFNFYGNNINQKSYDLSLATRGAGIFARRFMRDFDLLAFEGSCGFASWNGHMAPHGSDDQALDQAQKLSDSFHAYGLTFGAAAALSWVWEHGFFLEWTFAGLQYAKILKKDFSRDDGEVNHAVTRDIEGARIYGIVDLKVGWYF